MANKVVIYGKGEKSKFTASSFLEAAGLTEQYAKFIGNGLNIGGLNMGTDKDFRIVEGSKTLDVIAPETDMVTVELEFDEVEVDRPVKTPEYQAEQLAKQAAEAAKE